MKKDADLVFFIFHQSIDEVRADESSSSSDQNSHIWLSSTMKLIIEEQINQLIDKKENKKRMKMLFNWLLIHNYKILLQCREMKEIQAKLCNKQISLRAHKHQIVETKEKGILQSI